MGEVLLVTGASGSVGSNVCRLAAERGYRVRALVRDLGGASALQELGVELVEGDVRDPESLRPAAEGASRIVHAAAQIGGTWSTAAPEDFHAINFLGAVNVLDAAQAAGVVQTVLILSMTIVDRAYTVTEVSPLVAISPDHSPYNRAKLAAYYHAMAQAAVGMPITFVLPGAIYGPTPLVERALVPTSFTGTLVSAARGELTEYLPSLMGWVLASEVADVSLAAVERGRIGVRYLATGRAEDVISLPAFCNRFLEMAGIDRRVAEIDINDVNALAGQYGSMVKYVHTSYPDPPHDPRVTTSDLGVDPTSLHEGLSMTLDWLRAEGRI